MNHYVLAETTDTQNGRPTTPGDINGGLFSRDADFPAQAPRMVIGVEDIAAAMKRVTDAGGKIHGEPVEIPDVGLYVGGETAKEIRLLSCNRYHRASLANSLKAA